MRSIKNFLLVLGLALGIGFAQASESPEALAERVSNEVLETIKKKPSLRNDMDAILDLVENKVFPHFNIQHMTAMSIGKDWKGANAEQKKRLAEEFKVLLVRTYSNALTSPNNQKVVLKPSRTKSSSDEVEVRTDVTQLGGPPVSISYWMENIDGEWKVFDVVVSGISLITNYRSQFGAEIRQSGYDGLITTLEAKNKSK